MLQDLILQSSDLGTPTPVPTPEWPAADGQVFASRASTADLAAFWAWFSEHAKDGDALAPWAVCWFACDSTSRPLFDRKPETSRQLATKAGCTVSRIFHAVDDMNYLTEASRERFRKNLTAGASAATSSSPGSADSPADPNSTAATPTPAS